jgi:hypothetical protein
MLSALVHIVREIPLFGSTKQSLINSSNSDVTAVDGLIGLALTAALLAGFWAFIRTFPSLKLPSGAESIDDACVEVLRPVLNVIVTRYEGLRFSLSVPFLINLDLVIFASRVNFDLKDYSNVVADVASLVTWVIIEELLSRYLDYLRPYHSFVSSVISIAGGRGREYNGGRLFYLDLKPNSWRTSNHRTGWLLSRRFCVCIDRMLTRFDGEDAGDIDSIGRSLVAMIRRSAMRDEQDLLSGAAVLSAMILLSTNPVHLAVQIRTHCTTYLADGREKDSSVRRERLWPSRLMKGVERIQDILVGLSKAVATILLFGLIIIALYSGRSLMDLTDVLKTLAGK